jgi:cell wall-associated NlpC family hydrolase
LLAGRTLLRSLLIGVAAVAVLAPASAALANPTPAEIQKQLDDGYKAVELVIESYNKVNGDLAATQASLATLDTKMQPLQSNIDAASANVGHIAVAAYQTGSNLRTVSLLLSASSSDTFVDQLATLKQLSRSQQHEINTYTDAKKSFDSEKKRLNDLLAAQNAEKTDLATKKTKIDGDIARLASLQKQVGPAPAAKASSGPPPAVSGKAGVAVSYAWNHRGYRYVYATAGPNTFDCSGLIMAAWRAAGVSLPHNAAQQYRSSHVRQFHQASQLAPGDLVFSNGLGHVGIYIGNGTVIDAPHPGAVVRETSVNSDPVVGFGRVVG